jgi:tRNA(Arg) A34 adenosine deaminase TadA
MKIICRFIVVTLFFFLNVALAQENNFCDAYNPILTHMNAIEGNDLSYSGVPLRLSEHAYQTLAKTWDGYCPECTLKDKTLCAQRACQKQNLIEGRVYQGIQSKGDAWMKMAAEEALKSVQNGGGPFGAVIVQVDDHSGKVIRYWVNHNHVAEWADPTAHAEVTTIRAAAKELGVLDLGHINKKDSKLTQPSEWSHCVIYSSAEPCPMCLSAIYWAGIKNLIFAATRYDAAVKGVNFDDKMIYEELALPYVKRKYMHVVHANSDNSLDAFNYYKRSDVARYGVAP